MQRSVSVVPCRVNVCSTFKKKANYVRFSFFRGLVQRGMVVKVGPCKYACTFVQKQFSNSCIPLTTCPMKRSSSVHVYCIYNCTFFEKKSNGLYVLSYRSLYKRCAITSGTSRRDCSWISLKKFSDLVNRCSCFLFIKQNCDSPTRNLWLIWSLFFDPRAWRFRLFFWFWLLTYHFLNKFGWGVDISGLLGGLGMLLLAGTEEVLIVGRGDTVKHFCKLIV